MFDTSTTIEEYDPELERAIDSEERRQEEHIELIASENYASKRVMAAQGSVLTNKYAEANLRMSTLPTKVEMSWLFSSPGSALAMATCRRIDGCNRTTRNFDMSPPYSASRLTAHGDIIPER